MRLEPHKLLVSSLIGSMVRPFFRDVDVTLVDKAATAQTPSSRPSLSQGNCK